MRFSGVQEKKRNSLALEFMLELVERGDLKSAHGARDGAGHNHHMALAAKVAQANHRSIEVRASKSGAATPTFAAIVSPGSLMWAGGGNFL
jgi:hypothetical protein